MVRLVVLISLIDLNESARPAEILAGVGERGYLNESIDPGVIEGALAGLLEEGFLSQNEGYLEIEYEAYGLIQEMVGDISAADWTDYGLRRVAEVAGYAAEIFIDKGSWEEELALEKEQDRERWEREAQRERELAELVGYPYDVLVQARETRRGRTKVYVVLLDEGVRNKRGVRLGSDPTKPAVYVGMTGLSVRKRFENHKANYKAGRGYVRDYGICLLPDLFEGYNPMTSGLGKEVEKGLAEKLRLEGYTVVGGH